MRSGQGLHNEVSSAAVPGPPFLGLLVEGRDVGLAANGSKKGKRCCACALHTHLLEDAACSAGLNSFRKHRIGTLVHAATQSCTRIRLLNCGMLGLIRHDLSTSAPTYSKGGEQAETTDDQRADIRQPLKQHSTQKQ